LLNIFNLISNYFFFRQIDFKYTSARVSLIYSRKAAENKLEQQVHWLELDFGLELELINFRNFL